MKQERKMDKNGRQLRGPFELFRSEFGQNSETSASKKIWNVQHFLKYRLEDLFEKSDIIGEIPTKFHQKLSKKKGKEFKKI